MLLPIKELKELFKYIEENFPIKFLKSDESNYLLLYKRDGPIFDIYLDYGLYIKSKDGKELSMGFESQGIKREIIYRSNNINKQDIYNILKNYFFIKEGNILRFKGDPNEFSKLKDYYILHMNEVYSSIDFGNLKKLGNYMVKSKELDLSSLEEIGELIIYTDHLEKIKVGNCKIGTLFTEGKDEGKKEALERITGKTNHYGLR